MEVEISRILLSPDSIRFACVVRGPKESWVRFAEATVPLDAFPWSEMLTVLARSRRIEVVPDLDEPLWGSTEGGLG